MILGLFRLTDRVAIVTGAGKGIGRGIALAFAEAGADVVCAARTQADIDAVADEVRRCGRRALAVRTDVMQTADLDALVQATLAEFGRIDVLVNNAGGTMPRAALDTSERFFEEALRFNATSAFLLSRMVVRKMVETRFSRPPRTLVLAGADGGAICGGYDVTTRTAAAKRLSSATGCSGRSAARPAAEPERWTNGDTAMPTINRLPPILIVIQQIIQKNDGLARLWSSAQGWAPLEAAQLLTKSRLDRQVSLSRTLTLWVPPAAQMEASDVDGRTRSRRLTTASAGGAARR